MTTLFRTAVALFLCAACGGSSTPAPQAAPGGPRAQEIPYEHEARRDAYCSDLCTKMTACAFEDAEATLEPEQVADLRQAAPMHTRECARECSQTQPTVRQLDGSRECLDSHDQCDGLLSCLDNVGTPMPG